VLRDAWLPSGGVVDEDVRRCVRPECRSDAAATMTYDYAQRTAWIDTLLAPGSGGYALCIVHADTLKVPHGWQRCDLRSSTLPGLEFAGLVSRSA
jgi:hypothetical protein